MTVETAAAPQTIDDVVLSGPVQSMIQAMIVTFGMKDGIGYLARDDVEQHFQEIVIKQFRLWRRTRGAKFTTYLYPRLRGSALDLIRQFAKQTKRGRDRPVMLPIEGDLAADRELTETPAQLSDISMGLTAALRSMPDRLRLTLLLSFYDGLNDRDAAERMSIGLDAFRELRAAALTKCRLTLLETARS